MRHLTEQQYNRLRMLGSGAAIVAPMRREWKPLLRRGLIEPEGEGCDPDGWPHFFRITPNGLHELAEAVERYGLPPMKTKAR